MANSLSPWKNINGKWVTGIDDTNVMTSSKFNDAKTNDIINNYGSLDRRLLNKQKNNSDSNVLRIGRKFSQNSGPGNNNVAASVTNLSQPQNVLKRWQSVTNKVPPEQRSLKSNKSHSTVIKIKSTVCSVNTSQQRKSKDVDRTIKTSCAVINDDNNNETNAFCKNISCKENEILGREKQDVESSTTITKPVETTDCKNNNNSTLATDDSSEKTEIFDKVDPVNLSIHENCSTTKPILEGIIDKSTNNEQYINSSEHANETIERTNEMTEKIINEKIDLINTVVEEKTQLPPTDTSTDTPTDTVNLKTSTTFVSQKDSEHFSGSSKHSEKTIHDSPDNKIVNSTTSSRKLKNSIVQSTISNKGAYAIQKEFLDEHENKSDNPSMDDTTANLSYKLTSLETDNTSSMKDSFRLDKDDSVALKNSKDFEKTPVSSGPIISDYDENNNHNFSLSRNNIVKKSKGSNERLQEIREKLQDDIKYLIKRNGVHENVLLSHALDSHNITNHSKLSTEKIELMSLQKFDRSFKQSDESPKKVEKKTPPKVKKKPLRRSAKIERSPSSSNSNDDDIKINGVSEASNDDIRISETSREKSPSPIIVNDISIDSEIFKNTDTSSSVVKSISSDDSDEVFKLDHRKLAKVPDSSDHVNNSSNQMSTNLINQSLISEASDRKVSEELQIKNVNSNFEKINKLENIETTSGSCSSNEKLELMSKLKTKPSSNLTERPSSAPACSLRYDRSLTQSPKLSRLRDSTLKRKSFSFNKNSDINSALQHLICDIEEDKVCEASLRVNDHATGQSDTNISLSEINTISDTLEQLNQDLSQLEMSIDYELTQKHGLRRSEFNPHENEAGLRQLRDQRLKRKFSKSVGLKPLTRKPSVIWAIIKKMEVALVLDIDSKSKSECELKMESFEVRRVNNYEDVEELAVDTFIKHLKLLDKHMLDVSKQDIEYVQMGMHKVLIGNRKFDLSSVQVDDGYLRCNLCIQGMQSWSLASLAYDTLISKDYLEKYCGLILSQQYVVFFGPSGNSKSYLASKLSSFISFRVNSGKVTPRVYRNVTSKSWQKLLNDVPNLIQLKESAVILIDGFSQEFIESGIDISELSDQLADAKPPLYVICTLSQNPNRTVPMEWQIKFKWIWLPHNEEPVDGLLQRFLRRKFIQHGNPHLQKEFFRIVDWLNGVWKNINRIIEKFYSIEATLGPTLLYSCPTDILGAEEWFIDTWNYSIAPYFIQAIRQGIESRGQLPEWEDPLDIVLQSYPWVGEKAKKKMKLREIRLEDIGYRESSIYNFDSLAEQKRLMSFLKQLETLILDGGLGEIPSFKRLEYIESSL